MDSIIGKDRDLHSTLKIVKKILSDSGFNLKEEKIINPVKGVWSVHLRDKDSDAYTNGKGHSKEAALVSAYCEFLERLGSGFFFYDYVIDGSYNNAFWVFDPDEVKIYKSKNYRDEFLTPELWDFYDENKRLGFLNFIDSGRGEEDSVVCLPFNSLLTNENISFPLELVKNLYSSNGLSVGNSKEEAIVQGLSECIERGVKNYIIREGLELPEIPDEVLDKLGLLDIKKEIISHGYGLLVKDASIDGRFPVICVLLINKDNGTVLSSFGSHPLLYVAIERTLTELLQGRVLNNITEFSSLTDNYELVADEANLESHFINSTGKLHINIIKDTDSIYKLWDFSGDTLESLEYLINLLKEEGYDIYNRSYQVGDLWISHSIVPQLSEIYPVEDLEYDNRNRCLPVKNFLKNYNLSNKDLNIALKWFDNSYLYGHDKILDFIGIGIDDSFSIYNITSDELELLVLLKLEKLKNVKEILNSGFDFDMVAIERVGFWSCLSYILDKKNNNIVTLLFNDRVIDYAKKATKGEIPMEIFPQLNQDFTDFNKHKNIISMYKKYRKLRG